MHRTIGLWLVLILCIILMVYVAYLAVANGPRTVEFDLYPWQQGKVAGYWVLIVVLGAGIALVPFVKLLVRTLRRLRTEQAKAAAAGLRDGESKA